MKNLAIVTRPMTALTRKDVSANELDWTSECEEVFTKVKELLTLVPILHPPDLSKQFLCLQMSVREITELC